MELKPGYKQTEVGVIPEEWDAAAVATLADPTAPICYGVVQVGKHTNSGISIVAIKYVKQIGTAPLHRTSLDLERPYARSRVQGGDVLISIKGTIGRVGIVPEKFEGNISRELARIRLKEEISPAYVAHQLESPDTQNRVSKAVVGTTRLEFSIATLRQFQIAIPKQLSEQRAIASALSDMDNLLNGLERLIAKKRDLKQAAMQQLLTGQTRLPGFWTTKIEKRLSSFGKFPLDWQPRRLSEISALITKGSTPTTYGFEWVRDGVLFLRSECVSEDGLDLSQAMFISVRAHRMLRRSEVAKKDILMTITGNVGRVVFLGEEFCASNINQHIARIRIIDAQVNPEFVFHFLSQRLVREHFNQITTGQAYPQISLKQVRDAILPIPSLPEQTAIAKALSGMDTELEALEARLAKTRSLKQAMMQELLTGRTRLV